MKKIKMQLFGSFCLTSGTAVLGEEAICSNKITRMLAYLLIYRDCTLTHRQLIDVFWEDGARNPEGALRNLMYRIRNVLKILGDEKFICSMPGVYRWNPEIEVETDYEQFEKKAALLRLTEDDGRKEKLCRDIIDCYRGNVSAQIMDEPWILPKVTWYQSVYMDTVKELCKILERTERWEENEEICRQALTVDSLDENIHCSLIQSLYKQKKYNLALYQYEKANQLFYERMGIRNPENLWAVFQKMISETEECTADINKILSEESELENSQGVFFCNYQIFRQIYQVEVRRVHRLGITEFIILLTVQRVNRAWQSSAIDYGMIEGMDILEDAVRGILKTGDVAARYSQNQVILLLPACTYESGVRAAERIQKNFRGNIGNRKLKLTYELAELSAQK
ncbi:MAG: BTAD domain-containing putative transcriptional regulator [Lachnospiraceae bacterium]|nr:BTAD domain-containing putative transcriptional regulator [Lachnospiraceae bacterium]